MPTKKREVAETVRPYRIRNAKTQKQLPGRAYKHLRHAHNGALIEARWAPLGTALEVIDARHEQLLGQYAHRTDGIHISRFVKIKEAA